MTDSERVMVFIDARNLLGGQKTYEKRTGNPFTFGYEELIRYFSEYTFIRGYYYDGAPHRSKLTAGRQKFFNNLRDSRITLRLKEIDFASPRPSQKGVDIFLASNMISLAYENAYDIAVLVSGDGDYVALIELIKSKGKLVWVVAFQTTLSERLRECADKVILIENNPQVFRKRKRKL